MKPKCHFPLSMLLISFAIVSLVLSACQPGSNPTSLPTEQPTPGTLPTQSPTMAQPPAETPVTAATQPSVQATQPSTSALGEIALDSAGVATDQTVETVEAVPASAGGPPWEAAPQYRRVTLQGYPVTAHLIKPQIFVYPAQELAGFNDSAGKMVTDLQALLQNQQPGKTLPFLPLYNAAQVMHAQVQYLDFKNGKGVRFLTQFDQAPIPINNYELIYTFQGLTSDGKYYVAAVLPVTHPDLPNTPQLSTEQVAEMNNFQASLEKTVTRLEQQPTSSFTPDLAKLDALVQSIEVK